MDDAFGFRLTKTFFRSFGGFAYGMSMGMLGPSIPDFCSRQGVNVEQLSWVLSWSFIFMIISSLVQGGILDRVLGRQYHEHYYGALSAMLAVATFLKSRTSSFWTFAVAHTIEYMCYPAYDIILDTNMLAMWGSRADPAIQLWHFTWALGFAVGPLIVRAYFSREDPIPNPGHSPGQSQNYGETTGDSVLNTSSHQAINASTYSADPLFNFSSLEIHDNSFSNGSASHDPDSQNMTIIDRNYTAVEMSFMITSLCFVGIVIVNIFYILHARKPTNPERSSATSQSTQWKDSRCFIITMCVMMVLFYFCVGGFETVFHTWVFSYAMDSDLNFTKPEAALLDSSTKFILAGSKLIFTPLVLIIPCQVLLMLEVIGCLGVVIPLALIGTNSKLHLWILSCSFNMLIGPLWGAFKGWLDKYIEITPGILGLMYIGVGTSGWMVQGLSGYIMMNDPGALMYVLVAYSGLLVVVTITMQIRASCHGNRYTKAVAVAVEDEGEGEVKLSKGGGEGIGSKDVI